MGGIAGIVDFTKDLTERTGTVNDMLLKQKHRGPDMLGLQAGRSAILGSCRLALCDPPGGVQPLTRNIGAHAYTLVWNGELFNSNALRQELIAKGYAFHTHSDTEVLLISFIEWGPSCVDQLNGMFAFAVWEEHRQRLFLARDCMGAKPLFYHIENDSLTFASELKALFCADAVKPTVGREGLLEIFALAPGRTPGKTPFKNISELRPGECMIFSRVGVYIHRYWQLQCFPHAEDAGETAEHLGALIKDAVKNELAADAPVCAFLSGGLDSSAISAIVSREFRAKNERLCTYSICYPKDEQYFFETFLEPDSDSDYINAATEHIKCDHTVYTPDIDGLIASLTDAVRARDLPGMADVDSSMLLLCREASKSFRVAFSGECADDLFGGYPWNSHTGLLREGIFPWSNSLTLRKKLLNRSLAALPVEEYAQERFFDTANETPVLKEEHEETKTRRRMCYIHIKWFMQNLLERQDRMGMQSSLEVRAPFCDRKIAEYAWNIPWEMMRYGGMEKGILRLAMQSMLPQKILSRKKSPFPKTHHPDYLKKVSALLYSILEDKIAPLNDLIDGAYVKTLLENPGQLVSPWYGQLMTAPQLFAFLIQINIWLDRYKIEINS